MRFRIFTEPQEGATYDDQLAVARLAEELGFDAYFRSDHYISFFAGDGLPGPTDAWTTLAGLARDTTRLRLGTLVSPVTFRLPGPLAIAVAQVDAMSGGRVELGLGAGWNDREHAAYGIPFPATGERFDRLEEQLAIITGLWATPDRRAASRSTATHYSLDDSPALPKPVQQPRSADRDRRVRRQAHAAASRPRYATEFNVAFAPPRRLPRASSPASAPRARRSAATRRRCRTSIANTVVCGADDAEVARRAAAIGRDVRPARAVRLRGDAGAR